MQVPPQVSAVKVDGERAYALARAGETLDLAARPLFVERLELVAVAGPRHRGLRDDLRQGRLRAQHRPRPRRAARLPRPCRALRRLWSGPFDSRRRDRLGDARGRGPDAGARRPAAAGAGGARRAAGARLPRPRGRAAAERQRHAAAGAGGPRGGRDGLGEPRRRAARGRRVARPGRCTRAGSSCSADGRLARPRRLGRAPGDRLRRAAGARSLILVVAACIWGFVQLADEVGEGETHELRHRDPARPAQSRRPVRPARPGMGRGGRPRRDRARQHGDPDRADARRGRLPVAGGKTALGVRWCWSRSGAGIAFSTALQARLRPTATRPRAARHRGLHRELPLRATR